ncbi:uncharacterized protein LOC128393326 isoform X2 [Panonychus citri]|uniref:uncharacterized protein LOC128393326 isoform X2 n=1 Tax=Panonychus citri TaxID=50023 RepID=UPI002307EA6D|nr:uncharacterized protein LOC128393326 isoform X2 [Panonychus citri]
MPLTRKLRNGSRGGGTPVAVGRISSGANNLGSSSAVKPRGTPGRPPLRGRRSFPRYTPRPSVGDSNQPETPTVKRGRGRPPKAVKKSEDETSGEEEELEDDGSKDVDESTKNDDDKNDDENGKSGSEIRLRRRDRIKTTARYSPELAEPTRRPRGRPSGHSSFPSTATSSSRYITLDSDEDIDLAGSVKRRKFELSPNKREVDASPNVYGASKRPTKSNSRRGSDLELDEDYEDDGALVDEADEDFTPAFMPRRKRPANRLASMVKLEKSDVSSKIPKASGISSKPIARVRAPGESTPAPKLVFQPRVSNPTEGSKITKITSPSTAGKAKVTFITTPKSVTLTATSTSFKQPPKRNYGSAAKFIDELPELSECTAEDNDPNLSKLPDKILFINSDLPLINSLATGEEKKIYLFRQVMSPVMTNYPCLLCHGNKFVFKEEKDLSIHYSVYHELTIDHFTAKFSEDIVFVCLPKSIIVQIEDEDGSNVILNAPCQYCGEEVKLVTMDDMKNHYLDFHTKEIKLIEQEEILGMHKLLYCSQCETQSNDFVTHLNHMKSEHKLHTYLCKCCVFTTQDASRLKTHFRAKHMISNNRIQNLQCTYCSGLIYGIERMNKHIMITHCVQTGANEFSCTACLQRCGKADELLGHSYRCPVLTTGSTPKEIEETNVKIEPKVKVSTKCFLCDKVFESAEMCDLHLNHVHTKWSVRNVIHDTFLMVSHPNGKTDLMPSTSSGEEVSSLKLVELPPTRILDEIGCKKNYGHYCFKCESIIKIYPLYYLHMSNVHKMEKVFECKISSCKQTFKKAKGLEEHMKQTKHPQKSVIEDPLGAIACHFCNLYFVGDDELQEHLLSEDHYKKINTLMDKSGNKPEPRNYKCKTCHTWFGLADSYIHHLETESHKHGCVYCGLHFALPSSRRTHIQSHHSEKSDICEICNVKQGSKERLFAHLVEHNIVFECNKCMRKFYQREQLNAHMETHGESRDCPWDGCERKITRSNLTTHIRQHRIENESKCNICGKGFSSRQVLQTHMEIHAKAESNAKAILQAVPNHNQQKTTSGSLSSSSTPGTTLISITTPPSSLTSIKQRSPLKGRTIKPPSTNKVTTFTTNRNSNGIPTALKIMCCSCNQSFNSHNELSKHKCVVPVVTITGTKPNSTEIQLDPVTVNNMLSSPILITQSDKFQLPSSNTRDETTSDNLEEDPQKLVLDIAEQVAQSVQEEEAEKLKQRQFKKVEQLLQQSSSTTPTSSSLTSSSLSSSSHLNLKPTETKKPSNLGLISKPTPVTSTGSSSASAASITPTLGSMQSRARRTYSSLKSTSSQLINSTNLGAENQIGEVKKSLKKDELITSSNKNSNINLNDNNNTVMLADSKQDVGFTSNMIEIPLIEGENANPGDQYIMLQQPDGQYVQICVPEGVDIEEVVRSLNITFSENPEAASAGELTSSTLTTDPLEQSMQEVTDQGGQIAEVEGMDDQQVIYLPVNEDGTCAVDQATLAMLTGNGEVPIIVTSGN